ncbi:hypothetical protein ACJ2A9_19485 [Anaerobacillus sp. MEB173]
MANRKKNGNQVHNGDTEFATELTQSKKARKKAARERKNNS